MNATTIARTLKRRREQLMYLLGDDYSTKLRNATELVHGYAKLKRVSLADAGLELAKTVRCDYPNDAISVNLILVAAFMGSEQ